MLDSFEPGDIAVFDRYYSSYMMLALLMARGADIQVFRDITQVAADAQCALKTGLQNAGIPLSRAFFQRNIFYLLRQVTQDHGCMLDRMRKESEMPLDQLPEIEKRYNLLATELKNIKTFVKQRKELFGKIDYHLRKIETSRKFHNLNCTGKGREQMSLYKTFAKKSIIFASKTMENEAN